MPLPLNPNSARGYVNNRNGFAISRNASNEDVAYSLITRKSNTGDTLMVETWYRVGDSFRYGKQLTPVLPYRVIVGDDSYFSRLNNRSELWTPQCSGTTVIYNPGMSLNADGGVTEPGVGFHASYRFIELNVTRSQLELYNKEDLLLQRPVLSPRTDASISDEEHTMLSKGFTVKADDKQAGMLVKNQDVNTDILYIWVVSTVEITGEGYRWWVPTQGSPTHDDSKTSLGTIYMKYSLPVLVKFEVDRTNQTSSVSLSPFSWKYALPLSKFTSLDTNDAMTLSRINSSVVGAFSAKSWNYNLLSGREIVIGSDGRYDFIPAVRGTIVDACWDSINDQIVLFGAHGYFNRSKGKWLQARYSCTYSDFTTPFSSETSALRWKEADNEWISARRISCAENGNYILTSFNFFGELQPQLPPTHNGSQSLHILELYLLTGGGEFTTQQYINGIHQMGCVHAYGTRWLFMVLGEGKVKLYRTGTAAQMISNFNGTKSPVSSFALATFGNFTLLLEYSAAYLGPSKLLWGGNDPSKFAHTIGPWASLGIPKIRIDEAGEDKTLSSTANTSDARYWKTYHLNTLFGRVIQIVKIAWDKSSVRTYQPAYISPALDTVTDGITSYKDDGLNSSGYFKMRPLINGSVEIVPRDIPEFVIPNSGNLSYWENPTFQSIDGKGVRLIMDILDCSGVYRTGNWTDEMSHGQKGVAIDWTQTRKDLAFKFNGDLTSYQAGGGVSGYWVSLISPTHTFSMKHQGYELVRSKKAESVLFSNYDTDGAFTTNLTFYLDLEEYQGYSDPGFSISDVEWKLVIQTQDPIVATGVVDISPPDPSGEITNSGVYKAVATVDYNITSADDTTLDNVVLLKNGKEYKKLGRISGPYDELYSMDFSDAKIGSYYGFSYNPLLHDSRSNLSLESEKITYVKGHKYSLSDVSITIDDVDKTEDIRTSEKPYLYASPGAANSVVEVTFSADHLTWAPAYPATDHWSYPVISGAYLIFVSPVYQYPITNGIAYEEPVPVGYPATYSNGSYAMASYLLDLYDATAASLKDYRSYGGTTVELAGETLSGIISSDGDWQIYLIIEDEFNQSSAFCVSNLARNYNIPFRRS